jgi:hypothetical protein
VVGPDHAVIADLLVDPESLEHIHIAVVGKSLLKTEVAAGTGPNTGPDRASVALSVTNINPVIA